MTASYCVVCDDQLGRGRCAACITSYDKPVVSGKRTREGNPKYQGYGGVPAAAVQVHASALCALVKGAAKKRQAGHSVAVTGATTGKPMVLPTSTEASPTRGSNVVPSVVSAKKTTTKSPEPAHCPPPVVSAASQPQRVNKKIILNKDGVATAVLRPDSSTKVPQAATKVPPVTAAKPSLLRQSAESSPDSFASADRENAASAAGSPSFNVGDAFGFQEHLNFGLSEARGTPIQTTPLSAAAVPAKAKSSAKKVRPVSSRMDGNVSLSHTKLRQLVSEANSVLPKMMQMKNLKQQTVPSMDAFLDNLHVLRETASLTSQIAAAQHRMTPAIHRQCCMRMLMLITTRSDLLELYKQSRGGSSQPQIDAGKDPSVNAGQGMGLNHQFHAAMNDAFNDATIVDDFPYDYFPSLLLPFHSNAVDKVATPAKFLYGLFVGMGLKQPLFPAGFPPGFFDITKLDSIFLAGIAEYHAHRVRFHISGNHNKPPWFFVAPILTLCPEKQEEFIDVDAKRWDSLAFHCVFEQIQEMQNLIGKVIPGGIGGGPSDVPEVGSSSRAVLSKAKQLQAEREYESDAREKELHFLKVESLKDKAKARGSNSTTALMLLIREQLNLKKDFETLGDGDMARVASDNVTRLKEELVRVAACSSSDSLSLTPVSTGTATPIRAASAQPQQLNFY
jgi:hypothetical protein